MGSVEDVVNLQNTDFSLQTIPSISCRICFTASIEELVSPCDCKGTLQHVHRKCLQQWASTSMRRSCELCGFVYKAAVTRRYSCFESIFAWLKYPEVRFFLEADILLLFATAMLTAVVCIVFIFKGKSEIRLDWPKGTLPILLSFIVLVYAVAFLCFLRHSIHMWYNWWKSCVNIVLIFDEDDGLFNST